MGQPLQVLADSSRDLPAGVPALHRTELRCARRWSTIRRTTAGPAIASNGLGQGRRADSSPHPLYLALGANGKDPAGGLSRAFRGRIWIAAAIDDIRLALNQSQPLGNERFLAKIEKATGVRREAKPRGRPRLATEEDAAAMKGQRELKR